MAINERDWLTNGSVNTGYKFSTTINFLSIIVNAKT